MKKILVVDDEPSLLYMLKETLSLEKDFLVTESDNGIDAIKKFNLNNPDLVILDIQIPSFSGYEIAKNILSKSPSTKILMLSADLNSNTINRLKNIGISNYISKPFNPLNLLEQVRNLIQ